MMAALRGQLDWARRLLERGAKVHQAGWSPLHYAATGPEPKIVALLLDRGAPIDAPSPNRTTPLMMAARYGAEASVDLLLARGADKRLRNDRDLDAARLCRAGWTRVPVQRLDGAMMNRATGVVRHRPDATLVAPRLQRMRRILARVDCTTTGFTEMHAMRASQPRNPFDMLINPQAVLRRDRALDAACRASSARSAGRWTGRRRRGRSQGDDVAAFDAALDRQSERTSSEPRQCILCQLQLT